MRRNVSRAVCRLVLLAVVSVVTAGRLSADLLEPPQARIQPPGGVAAPSAEPTLLGWLAEWLAGLV
jgi:hypothetical protein